MGKLYRDGEVGRREADAASSEKGMMNTFTDTSCGSKGKQSGFEPVLLKAIRPMMSSDSISLLARY